MQFRLIRKYHQNSSADFHQAIGGGASPMRRQIRRQPPSSDRHSWQTSVQSTILLNELCWRHYQLRFDRDVYGNILEISVRMLMVKLPGNWRWSASDEPLDTAATAIFQPPQLPIYNWIHNSVKWTLLKKLSATFWYQCWLNHIKILLKFGRGSCPPSAFGFVSIPLRQISFTVATWLKKTANKTTTVFEFILIYVGAIKTEDISIPCHPPAPLLPP